MSDSDLDTIAKKLDTIIRLVALDVAAGRKLNDQCMMLSAAGLAPKEIAEVLGKDPHVVSQTLYAARKGPKLKTDRAESDNEQQTSQLNAEHTGKTE